MALQFLFDECADEDVAKALQKAGIDVVTISQLNRKGRTDAEQMAFAQQIGRVVYTVDDDFLGLAADYWAKGVPFAGIVFHAALTRTKRQIIDALTLLNGAFEPADMLNHVEFI